MLISHITTHYHRRVPIQVGSQIIDQVTNCITEEKLQSLSQSWKLDYGSTIVSKSSQASDLEFDLDQVKGKVVITKKVIVPAFETVIARGLTKVTRHQTCVHVLVEPSPNFTSIFVPGNTSELIQGDQGWQEYFKIYLRGMLLWSHTLKLAWSLLLTSFYQYRYPVLRI